uniref:caffeoyl-CoA O-methyltransferase n=1 Tax=Solanum lycopersicum TaxID=4081 RepID=A0A3Q7GLF6_SOLLC
MRMTIVEFSILLSSTQTKLAIKSTMRMLELVKVGGIVVYDNTLWFGTVAMLEECVKETMKPNRHYIIEFNKFLASDTRVQISQVPIGDGITICWLL